VPSSIASDLSGLRAIPLRQNHDCRACRQEVRLQMSDDGSDGFNAMNDEQLGVISILLMANLEGASDHSDG